MGSAYLMIKDDLRGLIENGGYAVGELIPSQSDLAETYGVSAPTVKRAVELLVDALMRGLKKTLPERHHHLLPLNQKAIEKGMGLVEI